MSLANQNMSKKKEIIVALFRHCRSEGNFEFNKDLIKEEAKKIGFSNPYDVPKIDQSSGLPKEVRDDGYCIVLLGNGRYKFIKELDIWYHQFEPIEEDEVEPWPYKPSLLNHTDESESNIISVVYNQRIIQHFLYGDISESPMIYMSRRTKVTASYQVGAEKINAEKVQVEIDATFERKGEVTILEAKNGHPIDFSVYQLFHPFLVYNNKNIQGVKKIECSICFKTKRSIPLVCISILSQI